MSRPRRATGIFGFALRYLTRVFTWMSFLRMPASCWTLVLSCLRYLAAATSPVPFSLQKGYNRIWLLLPRSLYCHSCSPPSINMSEFGRCHLSEFAATKSKLNIPSPSPFTMNKLKSVPLPVLPLSPFTKDISEFDRPLLPLPALLPSEFDPCYLSRSLLPSQRMYQNLAAVSFLAIMPLRPLSSPSNRHLSRSLHKGKSEFGRCNLTRPLTCKKTVQLNR